MGITAPTVILITGARRSITGIRASGGRFIDRGTAIIGHIGVTITGPRRSRSTSAAGSRP